MVRIAAANTDRLVRMINDMLDLERLGAGRMETRRHRYRPAPWSLKLSRPCRRPLTPLMWLFSTSTSR